MPLSEKIFVASFNEIWCQRYFSAYSWTSSDVSTARVFSAVLCILMLIRFLTAVIFAYNTLVTRKCMHFSIRKLVPAMNWTGLASTYVAQSYHDVPEGFFIISPPPRKCYWLNWNNIEKLFQTYNLNFPSIMYESFKTGSCAFGTFFTISFWLSRPLKAVTILKFYL